MNTRALRRTGLIAGALTTSALVLAGCAGGSGGAATADPNEKVCEDLSWCCAGLSLTPAKV